VRYPLDWNLNEDWTHNEPDLTRAPLLRALDLGARDVELMRAFPDRTLTRPTPLDPYPSGRARRENAT
jgi:hypothetical protein